MNNALPPSPRRWLVLALSLLPAVAHAHPGHEITGGLLSGAGHPLTGLDHACAMIAVGLWAAQLGGRALWALPLSFLAAMTIGGALGIAGTGLPLVEPVILVSLLVLGILIAAAVRLPLAAAAALVAVFALFHGHAHGAEMPATASALTYAIGFVGSTALLHLVGLCFGRMVRHAAIPPLLRVAGATIAAVGVGLLAFK